MQRKGIFITLLYNNNMKKTWAVISKTLKKKEKKRCTLYHVNAMVVFN